MTDEHPILKVPSAEPAVSLLPKTGETGEPWNVLNTLAGHAAAMNSYAETKEKFDKNFPQAAPKQDVPTPLNLAMISAGRRITPDPDKYVTVRTESRR